MRFPRLAPVVAVALFTLSLLAGPPVRAQQSAGPVVRLSTSLGNIDVQLLPEVAPSTVANFLGYVDRGDYNGSFIHRLVPGFVFQGGGYRYVNGNVETIPEQAPVVNEFNRSNLRGTIAMAKRGTGPDTATDQWFFNLGDNSGVGALPDGSNNPNGLDFQNGGFTVFGQVLNDQSLAVMDAIAAVPTYVFESPFDQIPLVNYTLNAQVTGSNLVQVGAITRLAATPSTVSVVGTPNRGGFVVSRPDGLDAAVTVFYHNGGSAVRDGDYVAFPNSLTLPAGQSEALIPVTLLPGANRNHKVKVFLDADPGGAYQIGKAQSKVFLSDLR